MNLICSILCSFSDLYLLLEKCHQNFRFATGYPVSGRCQCGMCNHIVAAIRRWIFWFKMGRETIWMWNSQIKWQNLTIRQTWINNIFTAQKTHTHTHLQICTKHPFTALNVMLERRVDSRCYQEFRSRKFKHTISSLSSAFVGIRTHGTEMRNSDVWRKFIQYDKTYDAEIIALRMRVCERLPMVREKNLYTWWKLAACV